MINKTRNISGFTLIELLVVLAIIGILSTLAVYSTNVARLKSRDTKRITDISQVQTALELYFADQQGYPVVAAPVTLGGASAQTLSTAGFTASGSGSGTVFIGIMPRNITPGGSDYLYSSTDPDGTACTVAPCDGYNITFNLEEGTGSMAGGNHFAHPGGID